MNKRVIGLLLCILMLMGMALPAYAEETENAETTEAEEMRELTVSTAEEFLQFAENCRLDTYSRNLLVTLNGNIDLTGHPFIGVPIFNGIFDGKDHQITGLSVTGEGSMQGLFRYLAADATVRNLSVSGEVHPGGSRSEIGGIAGRNEGQILNCTFTGSVSGSEQIGGIAGTNAVTGVIDRCRVNGDIHGDHFVGGIAGENSGVVRNSENFAGINTTPQQNSIEISDITMDVLTNTESANTVTDIGGIAGISSGVIRNSDNFGNVGYRHMGYNIGGIAGTQSGYLADCENRGNIQGRKEVGGIVGQMEPATSVVYTEDAIQILREQLGDLSGMVNQTSGNAQTNASQIGGQIAVLQDQTQTALDAVDTLFPDADNPEIPDPDTILAAQNTLSTTLNAMPGTLRSIAAATQTTVNSLSRDLSAISGQISAMSETVNGAAENLGGSIADVSDLDTPELLTGKVENCSNYGTVLADLNVGGIAGAIAMENDLDLFSDWEQEGEASLNFQSEIRAVILNCENVGTVTGKKQNVGGIAGWQMFGLIRNTANTGNVNGENADYVGGISGMSTGYLRSDWVKAEICGKTYVGGIAGSATVVSHCLSQVKLDGAKEKQGAVLGFAEKTQTGEESPIAGNYYLCMESDPGAIDGISYARMAEGMRLDDFMQLENLPQMFQTVSVRFLLDDGSITEISVVPGETLKEDEIPVIPPKEGYTGTWGGLEETDLQSILFDMTFEAVYTAHRTVVQTERLRENSMPVLLAEGSFTGQAAVTVSESDMMPELGKGESLLEAWKITLSEAGETVRFLPPQEMDLSKLKLYASGTDGNWQEMTFHIDGSYLVFPAVSTEIYMAVAETQNAFPVWSLAIVGAAVLALAAVWILRKKPHKKQS